MSSKDLGAEDEDAIVVPLTDGDPAARGDGDRGDWTQIARGAGDLEFAHDRELSVCRLRCRARTVDHGHEVDQSHRNPSMCDRQGHLPIRYRTTFSNSSASVSVPHAAVRLAAQRKKRVGNVILPIGSPVGESVSQ